MSEPTILTPDESARAAILAQIGMMNDAAENYSAVGAHKAAANRREVGQALYKILVDSDPARVARKYRNLEHLDRLTLAVCHLRDGDIGKKEFLQLAAAYADES